MRMCRNAIEPLYPLFQTEKQDGSLMPLPHEITALISSYMTSDSLTHFSQTARRASIFTYDPIIKKAEEFGFEKNRFSQERQLSQARLYLKNLSKEIIRLRKYLSNHELARFLQVGEKDDFLESIRDKLSYCRVEEFMLLMEKAMKLNCQIFFYLFPKDFQIKFREEINPFAVQPFNQNPINRPTDQMFRTFYRAFLSNRYLLSMILKNFNKEGISFYDPVMPLKFVSRKDSMLEGAEAGVLHTAINNYMSLEIFELLLINGFSIQEKTVYQMGLLHMAVLHKRLDLAKYLIHLGIDVNYYHPQWNHPVLYSAVNINDYFFAKFLIEQKAQVNIANPLGHYPIAIAVENDNIKMVDLLIKAGSSMRLGYKGNTPLHIAVTGDYVANMEMIHLLYEAYREEGVDIDIKNNEGKSPLDLAIEDNQIRAVLFFLEKGSVITNTKSITPLHWAARNNSIKMLRIVLDHMPGVDIDCVDLNGKTPLSIASQLASLEMVVLLIEKGADINAFDRRGVGPLHGAVYSGSFKKVRFLLEQGALVNVYVTRYLITPLSIACGYDLSHYKRRNFVKKAIVEALIQAGADPSVKVEGYSLKHWLKKQGDIKKDQELKEIYGLLEN